MNIKEKHLGETLYPPRHAEKNVIFGGAQIEDAGGTSTRRHCDKKDNGGDYAGSGAPRGLPAARLPLSDQNILDIPLPGRSTWPLLVCWLDLRIERCGNGQAMGFF
ncbi:hypothetical protein E2C01_101809 [Portunus trituberculatus]|uniref:Uncharacterized protein n=1 Tax=Portunus trituberculatus TaxID=210409 RepID=A0A5B7KFS0_PORTR|nr:hypothetical protein [Portunus trituberculatus]